MPTSGSFLMRSSDELAPNAPYSTSGAANQGQWLGHPRQLFWLFSTEMWERFGYYGMRAILALYLTNHFLFRDDVVGGLYGAFTSLVYLTPLFGGLIADRILGAKRSIKFGAILMAIGYFGLCFGGEQAKPYLEYQGTRYEVVVATVGDARVQYVVDGQNRYRIMGQEDGSVRLIGGENSSTLPATLPKGSYRFDGERNMLWVNLMLLSLTCVIIGNGFFKPNISSIVGTLYKDDDPRRDSGFTIFYMGINLGSLISQFSCPLLADLVGWWAGFLLAALGMALSWGLMQFDGGRLKGYGERPETARVKPMTVYICALLTIPLIWFLIYNTMISAEAAAAAAKAGTGILGYLASLPVLGQVLFVIFLIAMVGIPIYSGITADRVAAQKMFVAVVLTFFSVVFWTLFEQAGSSLTLFAERSTDRDLGFYTMPAGQVQIFNALFIVLLAPVFSILWTAMAKRGIEPSTPIKFAIGLMLVGAGFLVLVLGAGSADSFFKVGLVWLAMAYLIHSIGELCLSPVGLSMITKLSIPSLVGMMMGVWFLSSAMAQYVGGIVAQFASVETVGGEVTNPKLALDTYVAVFQSIGWVSVGIGIGLLVIAPLLSKMMHGVK
jgi:POT family proton-dependent oligopeptide transporter